MKTKRFFGILFLAIMVFASACGSNEEGDKPSDPVTQPPGSTGNMDNQTTSGQQTAITIDQAKEIALKDAGVDSADALNIRAKLSKDDGGEEYEVKFRTQEKEYEYEISAADGTILLIEETSLGTDPEPSTDITEAEAKEIALKDAGISEAETRNFQIHLDKDDLIPEYEIEFEFGNKEYEYEISVSDGTIRSRKVDLIDDSLPTLTPIPEQAPQDTPTPVPAKPQDTPTPAPAKPQDTPTPVPAKPQDTPTPAPAKPQDTPTPVPAKPQDTPTPVPTKAPQTPTPANQMISEKEAKQIAFMDAGVTEADISNFRIKLDYDDGRAEYEVDFDTDGKEYEYNISAADGTILSKDIDAIEDSIPATVPGKEQYITENEAKQIAFMDAGVTEAEISNFRIKLDYDDGQAEYEIEFEAGNREYSYDIAAVDGTILSREIEIDNDSVPFPTPGPIPSITAEEAKQIAFASAGVTEAEVWDLEIEADYDFGRIEYEIEFKVGYTEYKYRILEDGGILDWEVETDEEYGHHSSHHSSNTSYTATGYHHNNGYHHGMSGCHY